MSRDDLESADEKKSSAAVEDDGRELDQQIADYLKMGLPVATLVCALVGGALQGAAAVVLVLAAGALVSVIAIFWASVRTLVGEAPLSGADAYVLGAPRTEEERKRAVLRALKDLEFERAVGKISDEDYEELVARYRAEAKHLLRMLQGEAQPGRHKVEALVTERLFKEGLAEPPPRGPNLERKAGTKSKRRKSRAANVLDAPLKDQTVAEPRRTCRSCGTHNDADAVFCKKCGARDATDESSSHEEADSTAGAAEVAKRATPERDGS